MSRMSTTCPNCTLHLAVTADDLRVGQGYVRCGRCERVFNALISLSEDVEVAPRTGDFATGTTTVPAIESEETRNCRRTRAGRSDADETPAEGMPVDDESPGVRLVAANFGPGLRAPRPISMDLSDDVDVVETMATGTFETIVLEGDAVTQTEEHVDAAEVDKQLQQISDQLEADEFQHLRDELGVEEYSGENVVLEDVDVAPPAPEFDGLGDPAERRHPAWMIAAAVLGLALLVQLIHHTRHSLIEQSWSSPWLGPVYRAFGVTLEPRWQLSAYDVRQLGGEAVADASGKLVLRATVLNRAGHPQPPPLLRVDAAGPLRQCRGHARHCAAELPAQCPACATRPGPAHRCRTGAGGSRQQGCGIRTRRLPADARRPPALRRRAVTFSIGPWEITRAAVLAPMAGVTDRPFRVLCRSLGAGLAASEMITADQRLWTHREVAPAHESRGRTGTPRGAARRQ